MKGLSPTLGDFELMNKNLSQFLLQEVVKTGVMNKEHLDLIIINKNNISYLPRVATFSCELFFQRALHNIKLLLPFSILTCRAPGKKAEGPIFKKSLV